MQEARTIRFPFDERAKEASDKHREQAHKSTGLLICFKCTSKVTYIRNLKLLSIMVFTA